MGAVTVTGGGKVHLSTRANSVYDAITDAKSQLNALDGAYMYMHFTLHTVTHLTRVDENLV